MVRSFGDEKVDLWWGRLFPNTTPRAETDKKRMEVEAAHEAFKQREEMLRLAVAGVAAETAIQAAQEYCGELRICCQRSIDAERGGGTAVNPSVASRASRRLHPVA